MSDSAYFNDKINFLENQNRTLREERDQLNSEILGILQLACDTDERQAGELIALIADAASKAYIPEPPQEQD